MNIYIEEKYVKFFLGKFKDFSFIADYHLDGLQFDKQRVVIRSLLSPHETLEQLLPHLPINTIVAANTEYPGKRYLLCVGEIPIDQFSYFKKEAISLSIITMKESTVRFNAWIDGSQIIDLFRHPDIHEFSSINGKFKEKTHFILEVEEAQLPFVTRQLSTYTDEYLVRDDKVYLHIELRLFENMMADLGDAYQSIVVFDEEDF